MLDQPEGKNQVDGKTALSGPQKEAVMHGEGPLLVAAGAGSGKTRTLTERLVYLIKKGVNPTSIVAITFTNKAANEMRNRITSALARDRRPSGSNLPFIGTFHSFGARILRKHAKLLGRTSSFVIFDDDDSRRLTRKISKSVDLPGAMTPAKMMRELSRIKNNLIDSGDLEESTLIVLREYESELERQNAFDFDDLIEKTVKLLREHPRVLKKQQMDFEYILVDEYQDINASQYEFLKLLAGGHKNLTVVGDDQQSIYGFRWSDFTNFLNFERDWPEAKIVKLGENYRSTDNIVRAAAGVIKNNKLQRKKKLWTENGPGAPIQIIGANTPEEEAEIIADDVSGNSNSAVLYRTNAQSRAIEQALNFNSIPYEIYGGVRFYERKEVKDIIAALRYAMNPKDEISRERLDKAFRKAIYRSLAENLPKLAGELDVLELIGFILKATDYFGYLAAKFENSEERIENVGELIRFASTFSSLPEFIERVSLLQATDKIGGKSSENAVKLMTIHLAKGLEFDSVHLAGVSEGLLPHQKSLFSDEDLEEERRLAYVAMTRAKEHLRMSFYGFASRFLYEIPPELVEFKAPDMSGGEPEIVLD